MRYTTVFPLHSKSEVVDVLIRWIHTVRLQLRERFGEDLPVLHLHSDRGGEFSFDLFRDFCRGKGILQSFTLPDSPQQNGIVERRIGLVMEVARTSMIHAAAPHFLWPFAVRYAAHQLNLWPRVSLPKTSPTLRWTGKVGDALVFRVWGSRAFVRDMSADKLSACAIPCIFLGSAPPPPPPFFLASGPPPVAVGSGAAPGAVFGGAASGAAEPGGAGSEGAGSGGAEPGGAEREGVEPGGAESEGAESGGAEPWGAASPGGPAGAGDTGAGGATVSARAGGTRGSAATNPRGARTSGAGAAGTGGVGCAGAGDPTEPGAAGAVGAGPGGAGLGGPSAGGTGAAEAGVRGTGAEGARPAGARAVDRDARGVVSTVRPRLYFVPLLQQALGVPSSTGLPPPFLCPPPDQSQPPL
ncbi:unnamed protein product [Closterium sp. NIES-53]